MKTAISLPDQTFAEVTRRAAELGMSRSQFFARAAERYLDDIDAWSLTERIDEALGHIANDDSAENAVAVGQRLLVDLGDEW